MIKGIYVFFSVFIFLYNCNIQKTESVKEEQGIKISESANKKELYLNIIKEISGTLQKTRDFRSLNDKLDRKFYYQNMETLYIGYLENSNKNKMFDHLNKKVDRIILLLETRYERIKALDNKTVETFYFDLSPKWLKTRLVGINGDRYYPVIEILIQKDYKAYTIQSVSFLKDGEAISNPGKDNTVSEEDSSEVTEGKLNYLFLKEMYTILKKTRNINSIKKYLASDFEYRDKSYTNYSYSEEVKNKLNLIMDDILEACNLTLDSYPNLYSKVGGFGAGNRTDEKIENGDLFLSIGIKKINGEYKIYYISYENRP